MSYSRPATPGESTRPRGGVQDEGQSRVICRQKRCQEPTPAATSASFESAQRPASCRDADFSPPAKAPASSPTKDCPLSPRASPNKQSGVTRDQLRPNAAAAGEAAPATFWRHGIAELGPRSGLREERTARGHVLSLSLTVPVRFLKGRERSLR